MVAVKDSGGYTPRHFFREVREELRRRTEVALGVPEGLELEQFRKRVVTALNIPSFKEEMKEFRFSTSTDPDENVVVIRRVRPGGYRPEFK